MIKNYNLVLEKLSSIDISNELKKLDSKTNFTEENNQLFKLHIHNILCSDISEYKIIDDSYISYDDIEQFYNIINLHQKIIRKECIKCLSNDIESLIETNNKIDDYFNNFSKNIIKNHRFSKEITQEKVTNESLSKSINELNELNEFTYIVSHDLQEPLRMVKSFLQLIEKKYSPSFDAKGLEYINFAVEGAERMQSLIMDLLEYSRIETRKAPLVEKSFNDICKLVYKHIKTIIEKNNISILFSDSEEIINVDLAQLMLAFSHIIDNSIKYSKKDIPCVINVTIKNTPDYKCISITDNGIGIEEQYFNKIILPFKRLHNRLQIPGNGIGLAICKKIMQRHEGKLELESVINEGTTVNLYFPK